MSNVERWIPLIVNLQYSSVWLELAKEIEYVTVQGYLNITSLFSKEVNFIN
jgi:hypothetical protein